MSSFKVRTSEFNSSNLNDLASSLSQAFSVNGSTGIVVNSMNINSLNSTIISSANIHADQASFFNLTGSNLIIGQSIQGNVITFSNVQAYAPSSTTYAVLFTGEGIQSTLSLGNPSLFPGITYKVFNDVSVPLVITGTNGSFINGTGTFPYTVSSGRTAIQLTSDGNFSWWTT